MWAQAETWIQKIANLLQSPTTDDSYPNDRLPSEQIVWDFALRGYRGPVVLVACQKYFGAKSVYGFIDLHVKDMERRGWPVDRMFVERDVDSLQQMAESVDAVRVRPAY